MSPRDENPSLSGTPQLERLVARLRTRLRALVILYGLGTVLLVVAGWLAFAFLADWGLRVPRAIRLLHGFGLALLFAIFLWRALVRPLGRIPGSPGLALLFERAHPELRELFISAVQFQNPTSATDAGDPGLVKRVLGAADSAAAKLNAREILDRKLSRQRFYAGTTAAVAVLAFVLWQPGLASIFLNRMVGGNERWPQRTHLALEIPGLDPSARVVQTPDLLRLRVARGTDLPIVVRASGVIPDEVELHFDAGRNLVLTRAGGKVFRTLLRSCQEDLVFYATGGDDLGGRPRVEVQVLQPPDVESIAIHVAPPEYTGIEARTYFDQDVEVLAGSRVRVHVLPFPESASGSARLLPEDRLIVLDPRSFPLDLSSSDGIETQRQGLAFELTPSESFGFRVELEDGSGLTNPDPGLFRVQVVSDRAPEIQLIAPARTDFVMAPGGAVPVRARATDDFGLADLRYGVKLVAADGTFQDVIAADFVMRQIDRESAPPSGSALMRSAVGSTLIEVADLGTEETPVAVDQRYVFEVVAHDNRAPEANEGKTPPIRARVVTPDELLRRMQERLARARLEALRLYDLQLEKRTRVEELVDAFDGDGAGLSSETIALTAALSGQRRVLGDAQTLARDLAAVAEDVLYARLDEKAEPMLMRLDMLSRQWVELRFDPRPWQTLASEVAAGDLKAGGFAQNLVELVGLALEISEGSVSGAASALDQAERAVDTGARLDALANAAELQTESMKSIERLLGELAEWDNFQNILSLTRDILNRQKALRDRTQKFASEK